jgi:hypothetical protein
LLLSLPFPALFEHHTFPRGKADPAAMPQILARMGTVQYASQRYLHPELKHRTECYGCLDWAQPRISELDSDNDSGQVIEG